MAFGPPARTFCRMCDEVGGSLPLGKLVRLSLAKRVDSVNPMGDPWGNMARVFVPLRTRKRWWSEGRRIPPYYILHMRSFLSLGGCSCPLTARVELYCLQ